MSRYSIALNKTPEETAKEKIVTQFGFNTLDIKNSHKQFFL
jgi:hypothetical protein